MNTQKQLTIGMALLFIFVISFYGIIIISLKSKEFLLPKVEKKINGDIQGIGNLLRLTIKDAPDYLKEKYSYEF